MSNLVYAAKIFLPAPFWWLVLFLLHIVSFHACIDQCSAKDLRGNSYKSLEFCSCAHVFVCAALSSLVFKLKTIYALASLNSEFWFLNLEKVLVSPGVSFPCFSTWMLSSSRKLDNYKAPLISLIFPEIITLFCLLSNI